MPRGLELIGFGSSFSIAPVLRRRDVVVLCGEQVVFIVFTCRSSVILFDCMVPAILFVRMMMARDIILCVCIRPAIIFSHDGAVLRSTQLDEQHVYRKTRKIPTRGKDSCCLRFRDFCFRVSHDFP